ncbi:corrinoid protein [Dysgonomonas sp. UBA7698]|uniref:corrinoid protein n=1 Tax=Dysgonomonas sp. UBA7698 TaxID=1946427 RepID=UPI0025C71151|nr:corrinoid protein [Dysgonomonas sp. UBA7698]
MVNLNELYEAILAGNLEKSVEVTNVALARGENPQSLINNYMIKAMEEIGARFEAGKAFVPNLLMSARAMKGALDIIKPLLKGEASTSLGRVVIGTVKGDLHDIGKNLVASMLEGCGFEVINIGVDVSSEQFLKALEENDANILCMSALLTTTMNYMKEVIIALKDSPLKSKVKVMVGGAPISGEFAKSIGADGFSTNANGAVFTARELMSIAN